MTVFLIHYCTFSDKSLDTDVLANEKIEITDSSTITEDSEKVKKVSFLGIILDSNTYY